MTFFIQIITVTFYEKDEHLIQFYRETRHLGARHIIKLFPEKEMDIKLNVVDYKIWRIVQERVYTHKITSVDELKQQISDEWDKIDQQLIYLL